MLQARRPASAPSSSCRTSTLLSTVTGVWPQPNKAIVGGNAFAHEAGIHQHGMLANPLDLRDHDARRAWALSQSYLVLGKHSGRHAVESRLQAARRARSRPTSSRSVTRAVKELADRKKFVYDEDLLALVEHARRAAREARCATRSCAGNQVLPTATVEVRGRRPQRGTASAVGNGPLDAALKAADAALGVELQLLEMHTRAVTAGKDAARRGHGARARRRASSRTGQAASTDIDRGDAQGRTSSAVASAREARAAA